VLSHSILEFVAKLLWHRIVLKSIMCSLNTLQSYPLTPLLHLQPKKIGLRATDRLCILAMLLVEHIAAFIERIDLALALFFLE